MTTRDILPLPESTYQLLLDAAGTWPDTIATQWIPDPADHARCLDWTYAELAGTVTRVAREDGRLVLTVTGADPGRVRNAVAGFALTVRSGPPPAVQTTSN